MDIKELFKTPEKYKDETITLNGWVKTARDSKTFGFIEMNDGTFFKNVQKCFLGIWKNLMGQKIPPKVVT